MGNIISSQINKTTVGWAVIIGVLSVVGYRYHLQHHQKANKQNGRLKGRDALTSQPKKENKAKKQRVESFASQAKSQPQSYTAAATEPETEPKPAPASSKSKDEIDDRAFAQRMVNNKQNKFAAKVTSGQKSKQKSVKQSKAKDVDEAKQAPEADKPTEVVKESASSSIAGADGDDDKSPITSPSVSAADATGVSDMLEQPSPGPSVLRLTNTEEKPKKAKKTKVQEPAETKKQRQNRQKREQEKAFREEQEKERRVLEEAQRRTARLAEGRAAKDGSAFIAAQQSNAWAGKNANGNSQNGAQASHEPLDTFENNSATTEPTAKAATPATTTNGESSGRKTDWADVPITEEQQMKLIAEDDEWDTVKTKKAKKAQKTNAGVVSSEDGSVNDNVAPAVTTSTAPKSKAALTNGRPQAQTMTTQSSFAALQDDGADLEEDEELEWDV